MRSKLLPIIAALCMSASALAKEPQEKQGITPVDTMKDGSKIERNMISFDTNYSMLEINGMKCETGYGLNLDGSAKRTLTKWLDANAKINLSHKSWTLKDIDGTQADTDLNLSLEGKVRLYSNKDMRVLLGIGANYMLNNETLDFKDISAYKKLNHGGPQMSLYIESRYIDLSVSGSALFGKTSSSYDRDRKSLMQNSTITIVPRYWKFEMPLTLDAYHQNITERYPDRQNFRIRLGMQPGLKIAPHVKIYLNYTMTQKEGEDVYTIHEFGGGAKITW